jgi:hypothetical protein
MAVEEGEAPPGSQAVDETRPAAAAGEVLVEASSGRLTVEGWERSEIAVSGLLDDAERTLLRFEMDGELTRVEVEKRRRGGLFGLFDDGGGGAELTVRVPRGSSVEVRTAGAEVSVDGVDGAVTVHSVAGPVTVSGTPSRLETMGVSSEVSFSGRTPAIHASTVSGGIRLESDEVGLLSVDTVSGPVSYAGALTADADVGVETVSGDVTLALPPDVGADFHFATRGAIENELGPPPHEEDHTQILDFVHGGGGATVRVESAGGVLSLRAGVLAAGAADDVVRIEPIDVPEDAPPEAPPGSAASPPPQ